MALALLVAVAAAPPAARAAPAPAFDTRIDTPASALVANNLYGDTSIFAPTSVDVDTIAIRGTAAGATDGQTVDVVCAYTMGSVTLAAMVADAVPVVDGRFAADGSVPVQTCRLAAVPTGTFDGPPWAVADATGHDFSGHAGPLVLGGVLYGERYAEDAVGSYVTRGQRGGWHEHGALAGGWNRGLQHSLLLDDGGYRPVFGSSSASLGFVDWSDGSVVGGRVLVDGRTAVPQPEVQDGATVRRSRVARDGPDPVSGDLTIVETVPLGVVPDGPLPHRLASAGVELERTIVQDEDGRRLRYRDRFRSVDGDAHALEVVYAEGLVDERSGFNVTDPGAYRLPWQTGDAYVQPSPGTEIAPAPAGATTIYVRGPRVRLPPADAAAVDRPGAAGTLTFDAAPSDGRFLSASSFLLRFVRSLPAAGTTEIAQTFRLVADPAVAPGPVPPVPGPDSTGPAVPPPAPSGPIPDSVAPPGRVTPLSSPLTRVQRALNGLLRRPAQVRRLQRRGGTITVKLGVAPPGRYVVRVRRGVRNGSTLLTGTATLRSAGTLRLALRPTAAGRRYLAEKVRRQRRSVRVRTTSTWTAPGQPTVTRGGPATTRFR